MNQSSTSSPSPSGHSSFMTFLPSSSTLTSLSSFALGTHNNNNNSSDSVSAVLSPTSPAPSGGDECGNSGFDSYGRCDYGTYQYHQAYHDRSSGTSHVGTGNIDGTTSSTCESTSLEKAATYMLVRTASAARACHRIRSWVLHDDSDGVAIVRSYHRQHYDKHLHEYREQSVRNKVGL